MTTVNDPGDRTASPGQRMAAATAPLRKLAGEIAAGTPYQQPTVPLSALFGRAADYAENHCWASARTLLGVVHDTAPDGPVGPVLTAYRTVVDVLAAADGLAPPFTPERVDVLEKMAADLRGRVVGLLVYGPDADPATGREES